MSKKRRSLLIVCFVCVLIGVFLSYRISYPLLHVEYNGKITNCHFDVKGYGEFEINNQGVWYQMHYLDCDLQLGDSMVKKMDNTYIFHYRNGKLIGKYSSVMGYRYVW